MGERKDFEGEMRRVGALLATMREDLGQSEAIYEAVLRDRRLPAGDGIDEVLAGEPARQQRLVATWATAERVLAEPVAGLGEALGDIRLAFDNREMPGRLDGISSLLSKSLVRRRQVRRFTRRVNPTRLSGLLLVADHLQGVVGGEQVFLADRRQVLEGMLIELGRQRPDLIAEHAEKDMPLPAGQPGKPVSRKEAMARTEQLIGAGNGLCGLLNIHLSALNVISHKLLLDTEELLILFRALAEIDGEGERPLPAEGELANIGAAVERYRHNRLVAPDAGRRRKIVDHVFLEYFFPRPKPDEEETAGEPPQGNDRGRLLLSRLMGKFRSLQSQ